MMIEINHGYIGQFEKLETRNTTTGESMVILPSCGANITELTLVKRNEAQSIIHGETNPQALIDARSFKSAQMFPFPNRVNAGKWAWKDKELKLPINFPKEGHAIHGLVFNKPFTYKQDGDSIIFTHQSSGETPGYPFSYTLTLTYLLQNGLTITTTVKNTGKEDLPFGCGWHPYLMLAMRVNLLNLKMPQVLQILVDDRMIPTGEKIPYDKFRSQTRMGDTSLDTGFQIIGKGRQEVRVSDENTTIVSWQDADKFPYVQVYTPKHRDSIAIEPMSCVTNALNSKEGLTILKPGKEWNGQYGLQIQ